MTLRDAIRLIQDAVVAAPRDPVTEPREGDRLIFRGGEVRVDRVANGWVYFCSWRGDRQIGELKRMELSTWSEAVRKAEEPHG